MARQGLVNAVFECSGAGILSSVCSKSICPEWAPLDIEVLPSPRVHSSTTDVGDHFESRWLFPLHEKLINLSCKKGSVGSYTQSDIIGLRVVLCGCHPVVPLWGIEYVEHTEGCRTLSGTACRTIWVCGRIVFLTQCVNICRNKKNAIGEVISMRIHLNKNVRVRHLWLNC